jgi:hypothetical protein
VQRDAGARHRRSEDPEAAVRLSRVTDARLTAVLDRLIPADDASPGAVACGVAAIVGSRVPGVDQLLGRLDGFERWDEARQDAALRELEKAGDPTFLALVEAAQAAFYADPRSWPALGYTTNVPGRS